MKTKLSHKLKVDEIDLDQIFCEIIEQIPEHWGGMVLLAEEAGVTAQTLWNWAYGTTQNPYLRNIIKVARALGYEVTLVRRRTPATKIRVVS